MGVRIDRVVFQAVNPHNLTDILLNRLVVRFIHIGFRDGPKRVAVRYDDTLKVLAGFSGRVVLRIGTEGADGNGGGDDQTERHHK